MRAVVLGLVLLSGCAGINARSDARLRASEERFDGSWNEGAQAESPPPVRAASDWRPVVRATGYALQGLGYAMQQAVQQSTYQPRPMPAYRAPLRCTSSRIGMYTNTTCY